MGFANKPFIFLDGKSSVKQKDQAQSQWLK